jgi:hypothetical protein
MVSPFRRHQQMVRGLKSAGPNHISHRNAAVAPEPETTTATGQEYAALRVLLHDNLRVLTDTASIEARNPMKAEFAQAFSPWLEGVLQAGELGNAVQDEILVTNMVWALDYGDFDYALRLGAHALKFNLVLPERYNRTVACFLAEDMATVSLAQQDKVTLEQLLQVLALVEGADMPDPAKAKVHKAIGRAYRRKADAFDASADNAPAGGKAAFATEALTHLQRARQLDNNSGVKTDIKNLEALLKKLSETEPNGDQSQPSGDP